MSRTLEFYFDYGSPYSYLADTQVEGIAGRTGATLTRKPMLLGGVFKATGNSSPAEQPLKSKWSAFDMPMWARHYGVPFQRNPHFPVNTLALMRGAAAAELDGTFEIYHPAMFKAMWVDGRNLNDLKEVAAVLIQAGLDAAHIAKRIQDQDVKDRLKATTDEAVARGVFGAPTSFVGEMMFFGNDRLPFVEQALKGEQI
ncbi:2-hydroxychromene-2-carboxylate isomerase [Enhydrobacter aerosaccus]|uniref:2-hydroxychromene-2-carboxylate isomerase n=1 Tax=Enhydrobacter aerosaccus TaxID=225324 RepID=A0A1T4PE49_9HYPH|nr:2-hydroxychromene-2-carboxylate isomerase [Enhydrobacter aerosaccus]SJZ89820.1 2-hydroxychromene-2-carboxylate isomerase [Enhydrobacter aerosaccus]